MKFARLLWILPFLVGCGNTLTCIISGDNARGRILFTPAVAPTTVGYLRVEWSTDGFATVSGGKDFHNIHSLVTFGYSICVDNDKDISYRAYQDLNRNTTMDGGEGSGRHDGTSDGNASYITVNIPAVQGDWQKKDGIDVDLDVP